MPTPAVNVVRYSALGLGLLYGIVHRQTLQAQFNANTDKAEQHKREHWVEEAKKAWAAKNAKGDGVVTDPEAANFDLEALLKSWEK